MPFVAKFNAKYWRKLLQSAKTTPLMGTLKRMVENQQQKVTVVLVDSFDEHDVLERMLEESKPSFGHHGQLNRLDYLLRSPWRYPPLKWGSRFGRRFEPSLFYGSLTKDALFAEAAYYRLVFFDGMKKPFRDRVISQFTVFDAQYQTEAGIDLTKAPFATHTKTLRHKARYGPCQELGTELRDFGVIAVTYWSARAAGKEPNIALFSPEGLRSRKHRRPVHGLCESQPDGVNFRFGNELISLAREAFLHRGQLPQPAVN